MHKTYLLSQTVLQSVQYHLNTPSVSIEPTAPCSPHPTATKNNILTPTFIHAPGLGPDLKGVRFSLDGSVCWGVLGRQAWQRVRGGRGCDALAVRGCQGRVHGWVCVDAPVAGNAMLGAVLAVFSWQLLLEKQINKISQLKVSSDSTPVKMEAELRTDRQKETKNKVIACSAVERQGESGVVGCEGRMRFEYRRNWIRVKKRFNIAAPWGKRQQMRSVRVSKSVFIVNHWCVATRTAATWTQIKLFNLENYFSIQRQKIELRCFSQLLSHSAVVQLPRAHCLFLLFNRVECINKELHSLLLEG